MVVSGRGVPAACRIRSRKAVYVNISQLRTFLAVVDCGSFSEAAKALGISQPAVTMQIQSLEADLGVTLIDRSYRRVDLTEAGAVLEPYARRSTAEVQAARDELAALSGEVTGALAIAASSTPGSYVVPRVLGSFAAAYPAVDVVLTSHDTAGVVDAVESGRAHVGVCGAIVKGAKVVFEPLITDEVVAICPPGSPLATGRVGLARLAEEDWVIRERGSGTRQVAEAELVAAGIDPGRLRVAAQLGTGEGVLCAIEGGLGVAMLSLLVAEKALALGTVSRVDLGDTRILRPLFTVLPKGTPTRAAMAFQSHLHVELEG